MESIKFPGNVAHLYDTSPKVELVADASSGADNLKQIFVYERGTIRNTDRTEKVLNENEGKVRSHLDESGADSWEIEFDGNTGSNMFEQLQFDKMRPTGAWPFDCDKVIPCNDFDGQTCGCSNEDGTNKKAIVYYLGSGSIMADKLDFKSCADLKDNGNIYDGYFNIDGASTYCKSHWSKFTIKLLVFDFNYLCMYICTYSNMTILQILTVAGVSKE